jgi:hypothetical protein
VVSISATNEGNLRMTDLSDLELRRRRAARNQSLFREVNERIEALSGRSSFSSFVCECADESCDAQMPLTLEEYERVRSRPNWFVVLPGHNLADVEVIDVASDRFFIVSKLGAGAELASELDPRSQ